MHVTKIVQFDWSAVFKSFWYKKLSWNRAAFYSAQVSGKSFSSVCHSCKWKHWMMIRLQECS